MVRFWFWTCLLLVLVTPTIAQTSRSEIDLKTYELQRLTRDMVKDQLVSPSTSKFDLSRNTADELLIVIKGTVTSVNRFNAPLTQDVSAVFGRLSVEADYEFWGMKLGESDTRKTDKIAAANMILSERKAQLAANPAPIAPSNKTAFNTRTNAIAAGVIFIVVATFAGALVWGVMRGEAASSRAKKARTEAAEATRKVHEEAYKKTVSDFSNNLLAYVQDPESKDVQNKIFEVLGMYPHLLNVAYRAALDAVQASNGSVTTKRIALEIGRRNAGFSRQDGAATVYDEHAIQNDIRVRCVELKEIVRKPETKPDPQPRPTRPSEHEPIKRIEESTTRKGK
jgi:hypothetical protein